MFDYLKFYLIPWPTPEEKEHINELCKSNKFIDAGTRKDNLLEYLHNIKRRTILIGASDRNGVVRFLFNKNEKLYGMSYQECFDYLKYIDDNKLGVIKDENGDVYSYLYFINHVVKPSMELKTPMEVLPVEYTLDPDIMLDMTSEYIAKDNSRWKYFNVL